MGKIWVLDTETKGTGASVVPLEKTLAKVPARERTRARPPEQTRPQPERAAPARTPRGQPAAEVAARRPRTFRVVDVMTRRTLGQGDIRRTFDLLADTRSQVDVNLYVWEPARDAWRLLSLREKQELWSLRAVRPASANRS